MNNFRKQIRKAQKSGLTNTDLLRMKEIAKKQAQSMQNEAIEKSFLFMLAIPLNVLVADYWPKAPKKKLKKFVKDVISLYDSVQNGVVTPEELNDFLYEMTEIKVTAEWLRETNNQTAGT